MLAIAALIALLLIFGASALGPSLSLVEMVDPPPGRHGIDWPTVIYGWLVTLTIVAIVIAALHGGGR